ncbi:MAG: hypothetical protein HFH93_11330 [Lachnospiraceae bacterium]|nr:hypothetical protein [Lachnospiraceae bacterium]
MHLPGESQADRETEEYSNGVDTAWKNGDKTDIFTQVKNLAGARIIVE